MAGLFKKKDIYIILAVVLLIFMSFILYRYMSGEAGSIAVVTVNGERIGEYPLAVDCTVKINGWNGGELEMIIADGKADMEASDCPDRICVKHRPIGRVGESIICLPNRVVITVEGNGETTGLDAVAR